MFKILGTYICGKKYIKCNIWRVAVRPSYIKDGRFLKVNARLTINVKTSVATERFLLSATIMEIEGPNYWYQDFNLCSCSFLLFTNTAPLPRHRLSCKW